MKHISRRLIFYFYGFDDYKNNRAIKIHLNCLKHYCEIFDEAIFYISVNDVTNTSLITSIENDIINIGYNKNVKFVVVEDTEYHESLIFYEEVVKKLQDLDGITFFGHTKGITNYDRGYTQDCVDSWITGMYYLNLEFMEDVENRLIAREGRFYGTFLSEIGEDVINNGSMPTNKNRLMYTGTFFWMNCTQIFSDYRTFPKLTSRWYTEMFPGEHYNWTWDRQQLGSFELKIMPFSTNEMFHHFDEWMPFLCGDFLNDYIEFKNSMIN